MMTTGGVSLIEKLLSQQLNQANTFQNKSSDFTSHLTSNSCDWSFVCKLNFFYDQIMNWVFFSSNLFEQHFSCNVHNSMYRLQLFSVLSFFAIMRAFLLLHTNVTSKAMCSRGNMGAMGWETGAWYHQHLCQLKTAFKLSDLLIYIWCMTYCVWCKSLVLKYHKFGMSAAKFTYKNGW